MFQFNIFSDIIKKRLVEFETACDDNSY